MSYSERIAEMRLLRASMVMLTAVAAAGNAGADASYVYDRQIQLPSDQVSRGLRSIDYADGLLYVADYGMSEAKVVDVSADTVTRTLPLPNGIRGMTVDSSGTMWATTGGTYDKGLYYAESDDTEFTKDFVLNQKAYGIIRDSSGNTYIAAQSGPTAITKWSPMGIQLAKTTSIGSFAIALGPDESEIYIGGGILSEVPAAPEKSICTLDYIPGSPLGSNYETTVLATYTQEGSVTALDVDANGNIYAAISNRQPIADRMMGHNAIMKIAPDGTLLDQWNTWDPVTGEVYYDQDYYYNNTNGIGRIWGISVDDASGAVYVSQYYVADPYISSGVWVFKASAEAVSLPEPSAIALFAIGAAVIGAYTRRKRTQRVAPRYSEGVRGFRRSRNPSTALRHGRRGTRESTRLYWRRASMAISAVFVFAVTHVCSAAVVPSDFVTITPIREGTSTVNEKCHERIINCPMYKWQALTTVTADNGDRYQFTSYYDYYNVNHLVVGRRKMLADGSWTGWTLDRTAFSSFTINDGHNTSSIGIDGSGYLHVSWGMHADDLLYTRSTASVLNDNPITLVGDTVGNSAALGYEFSLNESVTYPQFYNVPGSNDLLMAYRTGVWGDGDMQLYRWDDSARVWNGLHASTVHPWISRDYFYDSLPDACAYINRMAYDSSGGLHVTWCWRTGTDSLYGYDDYQSNHDIMYAYSPNQGEDWYRDDGTLYTRWGSHHIDENNAPAVVTIPEGSSLTNHTSMAVGPDDNVYMASFWAPQAASGDHLRQYMLTWYDGSDWHTSQITNRDPEYVDGGGISQQISESNQKNYSMQQPAVMVDDDNRVIVVYTDHQRDNRISVAISESPTRDDWQIHYLTDMFARGPDPVLDMNRWEEDGVLSILYIGQHNGEHMGEPMGHSDIGVLEWDARAYFSALNADADQDGDVDVSDLLAWQRDDGSATGLATWQSAFTDSPATGDAATEIIPEPTPLALVLAGIGFVGIRLRCGKEPVGFLRGPGAGFMKRVS